MDLSNSIVDTRGGKVTVTTGQLVTVFRSHNDASAAAQIASLHTQIERLKAEADWVHQRQLDGVKALQEAVEGGRASTATVTIPIWLDELRWAIVAELDARDELISAARQAAGGE